MRRIAMLVARGSPSPVVFATVAEEVARLLDAESAAVARYDADGAVPVGVWDPAGNAAATGDRIPFGGQDVTARVHETGRPARIDRRRADDAHAAATAAHGDAARSELGVPITVEGRLWGTVVAWSPREAGIPADAEGSLTDFADLVAVTIARAEAHDKLLQVAEEQAALRRVATLVAQGVGPELVFAAVAEEVGALFDADTTVIVRFEPDGEATLMGRAGCIELESGARRKLDERAPQTPVRETGHPVRFDVDDPASPGVPAGARAEGIRSAVDVPIPVEGRIWGTIGVGSRGRRFPADTEHRLHEYTDLIAQAIANAEARSELAQTRARLVATADATRRRIERDLHDGAQQRLVSLGLQVRAAQSAFGAELDGIATGLTEALDELREIAHGIHPAILAEGGLVPALRALARRSSVPVELNMQTSVRLPEVLEASAYYVVAEGLTNVAKHAQASAATVTVEVVGQQVRVSVRDDGTGGATFTGSGLAGLKQRVEMLGGRISLDSQPGAGTTLQAELPLTVADGGIGTSSA